jgi:hypothetical protein
VKLGAACGKLTLTVAHGARAGNAYTPLEPRLADAVGVGDAPGVALGLRFTCATPGEPDVKAPPSVVWDATASDAGPAAVTTTPAGAPRIVALASATDAPAGRTSVLGRPEPHAVPSTASSRCRSPQSM